MHLSREQVAALLPTLQLFVETGEIDPALKEQEDRTPAPSTPDTLGEKAVKLRKGDAVVIGGTGTVGQIVRLNRSERQAKVLFLNRAMQRLEACWFAFDKLEGPVDPKFLTIA